MDNLALACPRCNATKWTHVSGVEMDTGESVPRFNPRAQRWEEHFRWSANDAAIIEPLSPTGRVTVELLHLNSAPQVAIRHLLIQLNLHPQP